MPSTPSDFSSYSSRRRNTGAVTLRDVARVAGVAPITVSRAIREPDTVTPAVMSRITQAIQETGYIPNAIAGALSSGDSKLVAAIVPSISTLTMHPMLEALTDTLNTAGYQVMLGQAGYNNLNHDRLLQTILSRRPTGVVLTGIRTTNDWQRSLKAANIPVVEVWNIPDNPIDMSVGFSHADVARAAVDYLYERGRRQLAIFTGDDAASTIRVTAARSRAQELGLAAPQVMTFPAPSALGNGRQALATLISNRVDVDGIFCASDLLAQGCLIEAHKQGLRVPEQLAVIGCGDAVFAKDLEPALTSIWFDASRIGRVAAEFILSRTAGKTIAEPHVDVGFQIIERATS